MPSSGLRQSRRNIDLNRDSRTRFLSVFVGFVLLVMLLAAALQVWREFLFAETSIQNQLKARAAFLEQQLDAGTQLATKLASRLQGKLVQLSCTAEPRIDASRGVTQPQILRGDIGFWPDSHATCAVGQNSLDELAGDIAMAYAVGREIGIGRLTVTISGGTLSVPVTPDNAAMTPSVAPLVAISAPASGSEGKWTSLHADKFGGDQVVSWVIAGPDPKARQVTIAVDVPPSWFWQFTLPFEGANNEVAILERGGKIIARSAAAANASSKQDRSSASSASDPLIERSIDHILASESHIVSTHGSISTLAAVGDKPFVISSVMRISDVFRFAVERDAVPLIAIAILGLTALIGYVAIRFLVLRPARQAEIAVSQLSERLQAIFDAVPVGIGVIEDERRIGSTNEQFDALVRNKSKTSPDDQGNTIDDPVKPDMRQWLIGPSSQGDISERVVTSEARRSLLVRSAQVVNASQRVVTVTDITERVQMEADLAKARDAAESASRSKAEFLATMSHEIRTPMNGVIGMVDLLGQTQLTASQNRSLRTIRESAYALLRIINDILDFSKIEAGRLEIENLESPLADTVEGAAATLAVAASSKKIRLLTFIDPKLPAVIRGDAIRIRQILVNLCGNAVKFSNAGEVIVRAEPEPDRPGWIRFSVTDHGIGISEENQRKLFQQFSQAETSTTRRYGGTGLGLAICKRLSEMMGGNIAVSSVLGLGTRFTVSLPLPAAEPPSDATTFDFAGYNILIVGRSVDERSVCRSYLEAHRAVVQEISNLDELFEEIRKAQVAGLLMPLVVFISDLSTSEVHGAMLQLAQMGADLRMVIARDATADGSAFAGRNDVILVEAQPIRRGGLINTIAVALGLASPKVAIFGEADTELYDAAQPPSASEAERLGELILVAEDNTTNQEVIEGQLAKLGYACELVDNGKRALESWRSGRFALVLTDCHMPLMDGFELTRSIRLEEQANRLARTPIVAITANAMKGEAERCLSSGMDGYLAKPVELVHMRSMVAKWISRAPRDQQARALGVHEENANGQRPELLAPMESKVAVLDLALLREAFPGNEPKIQQILRRFLKIGEELIIEINGLAEQHDADALADTSHKLKSSALTTGAFALAEVCRILEEAGRNSNWSTIMTTRHLLASELDRVRSEISPRVKRQ